MCVCVGGVGVAGEGRKIIENIKKEGAGFFLQNLGLFQGPGDAQTGLVGAG